MFARDEDELVARKRLLEGERLSILSVKLLDTPPSVVDREQALWEGVELFNQERFWESHETLEQIWRVSKGSDRDTIQGLILTAAAFVHYQKGELKVCVSVLKRARAKMGSAASVGRVDLEAVRKHVDKILVSGNVRLFTIRMNRV